MQKWGIPEDESISAEVTLLERLVWVPYKDHWWPALLYSGYKELQSHLYDELDTVLKAQFAVAIMREMNDPKRIKVARLLGREILEVVEVDDKQYAEFYWQLPKVLPFACKKSRYGSNTGLYLDFHRALDQVEEIIRDISENSFNLVSAEEKKTWVERAEEALTVPDSPTSVPKPRQQSTPVPQPRQQSTPVPKPRHQETALKEVFPVAVSPDAASPKRSSTKNSSNNNRDIKRDISRDISRDNSRDISRDLSRDISRDVVDSTGQIVLEQKTAADEEESNFLFSALDGMMENLNSTYDCVSGETTHKVAEPGVTAASPKATAATNFHSHATLKQKETRDALRKVIAKQREIRESSTTASSTHCIGVNEARNPSSDGNGNFRRSSSSVNVLPGLEAEDIVPGITESGMWKFLNSKEEEEEGEYPTDIPLGPSRSDHEQYGSSYAPELTGVHLSKKNKSFGPTAAQSHTFLPRQQSVDSRQDSLFDEREAIKAAARAAASVELEMSFWDHLTCNNMDN